MIRAVLTGVASAVFALGTVCGAAEAPVPSTPPATQPVPASATGLADHRALYKMTLARTTPGSDIQGLAGEMALEVKSTCEGSNVRQVLRTRTWDGEETAQDGELAATSFESADAKTFRFTMRNVIDDKTIDDFQGVATRAAVNAEGTVVYKSGKPPPVTLPPETVFPGQYMERLIAAANAKERVVAVTLFDGAGEGKIFRSTSIIGPRNAEPSPLPPLAGLAHWPVVLSYFELGTNEPTPDYETSFDLYENGVSARLVMDYGDFAMRGELISLEILKMPKCK